MSASFRGHLPIVERLLAAGAQADLQKKVLLVQCLLTYLITLKSLVRISQRHYISQQSANIDCNSMYCRNGQSGGSNEHQSLNCSIDDLLSRQPVVLPFCCADTLIFKHENSLPLKYLYDCSTWVGIPVIAPCCHGNNIIMSIVQWYLQPLGMVDFR